MQGLYKKEWKQAPLVWFGLQCVIVVFPDHTHFLMSFEQLRTPLILTVNGGIFGGI